MAKKARNPTEIASSPAATGPAGSLFEGQVGAYYQLAMLVEADPRGLPGTVIDRVAFQRADEGRYLDDVIVHAHNDNCVTAVLEIQAKRTISFTPTDNVFKKVVGQIVKAASRDEFWTSRYELAIAIAKTSKKIDGAYPDVLTWARQIGGAETFFARIQRPGSANSDMRTFVETFRAHVASFGMVADNETIWQLSQCQCTSKPVPVYQQASASVPASQCQCASKPVPGSQDASGPEVRLLTFVLGQQISNGLVYQGREILAAFDRQKFERFDQLWVEVIGCFHRFFLISFRLLSCLHDRMQACRVTNLLSYRTGSCLPTENSCHSSPSQHTFISHEALSIAMMSKQRAA